MSASNRFFSLLAIAMFATASASHWMREPPPDAERWPRLSSGKFAPVLLMYRKQAAERLAGKPFVALDARESKLLTWKTLPGPTYLVRAVCCANDRNDFSVYSKGASVYIYHFGLGSGPPQYCPIVIASDRPPAEVYVSCGGAR